MKKIYSLSRVVMGIPIVVFGILNLINANEMIGIVPAWMPGGTIWVYLVGLLLISIAAAFLLNKHIKIASLALAVLMLLFVLTVYLPKVLDGDHTAMTGLLKDVLIAAGAIEFAKNQPKTWGKQVF